MARVEPADWRNDVALADLVARIRAERGRLGALYPAMLNAPDIARGLLAFGTAVRFQSSLDPGLRELVICLVGERLSASYELFRHREQAAQAGVSRDKVEALPAWLGAEVFTVQERAVFAYVDSLTALAQVPDAVFEALRPFFGDQQIVELTVLASYYNMICRVLNALAITPADEVPDEVSDEEGMSL